MWWVGEEENTVFLMLYFFWFLEAGAGFVYQAGAIMHDELKSEWEKHICRRVPTAAVM